MSNITRVGVDLAKNLIQVHAVDAAGKVVTNRALKREKFLVWCADLPAGCLVAMEACSGAHHWCRQLRERGFDARMIPAQFVAPYRIQGKSGKNDANDAAAVCEAASRPHMNFVPPKTLDQQGMLCVHRLREALKEERTACMNRIRGLLAEFGIVRPLRASTVRREATGCLEDLPGWANTAVGDLLSELHHLDERIGQYDQHIAQMAREDSRAQQLMRLKGIGETTASAMLAMIGNGHEFKCGRQFAAWLGLAPSQYSSGGKARLGHITKAGDPYMRSLRFEQSQGTDRQPESLGNGPGRAARLLACHCGHRCQERPYGLGYAGSGRAFCHARLRGERDWHQPARIQETRKN